MRIGIMGAMELEINLLKKDMQLEEKLKEAGMEFYLGRLEGVEVVLVKSGVGKVNAGICTQILVDRFEIDKLIFTGVAGAIDTALEVEDIVISTDLVQHDVDATAYGNRKPGEIPELDKVSFAADEGLVELAFKVSQEVLKDETNQAYQGRILSGDQFISSSQKVKELKETFGGYCTEMEGAAVAQAAYLNNLPFVIIRSISDKADEEADISFDEFAEIAAQHSYKIVIAILEETEGDSFGKNN